jgi:ubiquinone/menaquinone biosynthesis C-methylase UbiE
MNYDAELQLHHEPLMRACAIRGHERILDIGCGAGLTTRDAARSANSGSVLGVDTSAQSIERARELAAAEGLRNIEFEHADAQTYEFPTEHFDAAISRYGTMFFADPVAAFRNIRGALRPDGRLVMIVWQSHESNEWSVAISRALTRQDTSPPISAGQLDPYSLADPRTVERILDSAGFTNPTCHDVNEPVYFGANVDAAFEWVHGFSFTRDVLGRLDAEEAARAVERLRDTLTKHRRNGGVWFDARAWIVTAERR